MAVSKEDKKKHRKNATGPSKHLGYIQPATTKKHILIQAAQIHARIFSCGSKSVKLFDRRYLELSMADQTTSEGPA